MKKFHLTDVKAQRDPFDLIVLAMASLLLLYLHEIEVSLTLAACINSGLGYFKACWSFLCIPTACCVLKLGKWSLDSYSKSWYGMSNQGYGL